jgi:superfamily II DNA or RNA helicase
LGSAGSSDDDSDDDDDEDDDSVGSLGDFFDFDEDDEDPDAVPDFGQDEFAREADRKMAEMQRRAGMNGRHDLTERNIPKDIERFFTQVKEDGQRQRLIKINFQEEIHHWRTSELRDVIHAWELDPKGSIRDYDMNPLTAVIAYKYMRTILKEREKAKREDPDATEEDLRIKAKVHDAENYTNKVRDIKQKQLEQVRKAAKQIPAAQKAVQQAQKQNVREPDVLCTGVVLKRYQCGPAYHLLRNPDQHGIACFFKPGYGKTLTAVALATLLLSRGVVNKIIAITPKSLRVNIKTEFQKCGSPNALEALRKMKVYTYESMDKEHETLPVDKHTLLICDEAHRLRESSTKVFKAVEKIAKKCGKILAITATPFVNRTNDIVNLLHVLDPERIPSKNIKNSPVSTQQLKAYAQNLVAFPDEDISGLFAERRDFLVPCLLDDVQINELLKYDKKLGLIKGPGRGRKNAPNGGGGAGAGGGTGGVPPVFNDFLQNLEIPIEGAGAGGEGDGAGKNAYLVQTRQLSLGIYGEKEGNAVIASTKILNMFAELEKPQNLPALVFTAFITKGVDYILKVAKQVFKDKKLRIGVITGKIKESERDAVVQRLNRGELDVVLLSDAGSEGLNFRGVRSVHLLNMEWNPSITEQQIGRALRINAHRDLPPNQRVVNVYKYLSSIPDGLTMFQGKPIHEQSSVFTERRLYQIQMRKLKEQQDAMQALMEVAIQHNCEGMGSADAELEAELEVQASPQKKSASPISVSSGSSSSASSSVSSSVGSVALPRLNTSIGMCEAAHFDEGTVYHKGPYGLDYVVQLRGYGPGRTKVWEPFDDDESKGDI